MRPCRRRCKRTSRTTARKQLDARLIDNDPDPLPVRRIVIASNAPALSIVNYAKETGTDLIVMGTHGRGAMAHLLMGSVAERVVRTAPVPGADRPPPRA